MRPLALRGQTRYLLAAFLPKASISCLRHSIPSICSWAESSGPRVGKVATRADSDDLLWGIIGGAEPCVQACLSPCGLLASSPAPGPCGENSVCVKGRCGRYLAWMPSCLQTKNWFFRSQFLRASALSCPQCPHHSAHIPLCPSRYQHPHLQKELTGPSGKLPCSGVCCPNRGFEDKEL